MFYRILLLSMVIILVPMVTVKAQQVDLTQSEVKSPKNAVYLELYGSGILYTLNYERAISNNLHLRIGGGYLGIPAPGSGLKIYSVPLIVNKMFGKKNAKLELGAGLFFSNADFRISRDPETKHPEYRKSTNHIGLISTVGFRYEFKDKGLFRIGLNPRYEFKGWAPGFAVVPGVSIGAKF